MSFDLYLRGADLPRNAILNHVAKHSNFQLQELTDAAFDYVLVNPATGVYCYFGLNDDEENAPANSLALTLNYSRPTFFALESMPLVESLSREFDLLVEDPQEEQVGPASQAALIESWRVHNERAVNALKEQGVAQVYVPESKANEWWEYTRLKDTMTQNFGDTVFVPELLMLRRAAEEPFRMFVSPAGIRQILPPSDVVLVDRIDEMQAGKIDRGFVSRERFMDLLGPYTTEYRVGTQSYRLLDPVEHPNVTSITRQLVLAPITSQYERVEADAYHNVVLD